MVRTLVCSYLKRAANGLDLHDPAEPDDNYVHCDKGMLYLRKAMALSAPNMKGASAEKVSDIIEDAQRLIDPLRTRTQQEYTRIIFWMQIGIISAQRDRTKEFQYLKKAIFLSQLTKTLIFS